MFLNPKKVKTVKKYIQRKEELRITRQDIDALNRKILKDCNKKKKR